MFIQKDHFVKSVQIRSNIWSLFSCIRAEYKKIRARNNSVFQHFSRSVLPAHFTIFFSFFLHLKWRTWLSKGGCESFRKSHCNKMIPFLLTAYFHGTKNKQSMQVIYRILHLYTVYVPPISHTTRHINNAWKFRNLF